MVLAWTRWLFLAPIAGVGQVHQQSKRWNGHTGRLGISPGDTLQVLVAMSGTGLGVTNAFVVHASKVRLFLSVGDPVIGALFAEDSER